MCSSDLLCDLFAFSIHTHAYAFVHDVHLIYMSVYLCRYLPGIKCTARSDSVCIDRSEERRVGKECRSRGSTYH